VTVGAFTRASVKSPTCWLPSARCADLFKKAHPK
jgi:hypothetical protein